MNTSLDIYENVPVVMSLTQNKTSINFPSLDVSQSRQLGNFLVSMSLSLNKVHMSVSSKIYWSFTLLYQHFLVSVSTLRLWEFHSRIWSWYWDSENAFDPYQSTVIWEGFRPPHRSERHSIKSRSRHLLPSLESRYRQSHYSSVSISLSLNIHKISQSQWASVSTSMEMG